MNEASSYEPKALFTRLETSLGHEMDKAECCLKDLTSLETKANSLGQFVQKCHSDLLRLSNESSKLKALPNSAHYERSCDEMNKRFAGIVARIDEIKKEMRQSSELNERLESIESNLNVLQLGAASVCSIEDHKKQLNQLKV